MSNYNREIEGRAVIKTPVSVRADILIEGRVQVARGYRYNASPKALIAQALHALSLENACLGDMPDGRAGDDGLHIEDAAVKARVRCYLESWVVPRLERAYDKLNKTAKGGMR